MARRRSLRWLNRSRALGNVGGAGGRPRRRAIGAGASGDPRDGDGDGFYSPKPGMPDKTPVPAIPKAPTAPSAIGVAPSSVTAGFSENDYLDPRGTYGIEAQRKAHAAALRIQQDVLAKHGNVRSKKAAIEALEKAFPNAKLQAGRVLGAEDFFAGEREDLSSGKFNHIVGLLHMADTHPQIADRIVSLRRDRSDPAQGGYHMLIGDLATGEWEGTEIGLNQDLSARSVINMFGDDPLDSVFPWGMLMIYAMREHQDEFSMEDIDRIFQQQVAMHEYAHGLHSAFGLSWYGVDGQDKKLPVEIYKKSMLKELQLITDQYFNEYLDEGDFEDAWAFIARELQRNSPLNDPEGDHERAATIMDEMTQAFARSWGTNPTEQAQITEWMRARITKRVESEWSWDGEQDERKRAAIRRQLGRVSSYGDFEQQEDPSSQHLEAIAETISAGEFGYEPKGAEGQIHIEEILGKSEKNRFRFDLEKIRQQLKKNSGKRYDFPTVPSCRGYKAEPVAQNRKPREVQSKALGTAIGSSSDDPRDGDGDGFYSPRPGMPDKTPVPARVAANEISSPSRSGIIDRFSGIFLARDSQFTLENQREAHKSAIERQQRVIKKYGDIRSKRKAAQALRRAYPNSNFRDLFDDQGRSLNDATFDMIVGMLDMADQYPKIALRTLDIKKDQRSKTLGGSHTLTDKSRLGLHMDNPAPIGHQFSLNTSYDAIGRATDEDNDPAISAFPWALLMGIAMKGNPSEFSDQDVARIVNQGIAVHEFGHALHASYGFEWHGMLPEGNPGPTDDYQDSLLDTLNRYFIYKGLGGIDVDEVQEAWDDVSRGMQEASPINNPTQSHRRLYEVGHKVIEDIVDDLGLVDELVDQLTKKWVSEIAGRHYWDGYSDDPEKRLSLRKSLSKVSTYATHGAQTDPSTQYIEGVAETFSAQQFGYRAEAEAARDHIVEIMKQAQKVATQQTKQYEYDPDRLDKIINTPIVGESPVPEFCRGLSPLPLETFAGETQPTPRKLKGKALGVPIGADDDEPDDGDGDGKYTAVPGGEDNVPMPPESLKEVVKWDAIADIINFDVFPERITDLDEDDAAYDVRQQGVDAWSMWGACRSIRKAAYELAGLSPDIQDPNIERRGGYFGGGWEMAEDDDQITEYARYFMAELVVGARGGYSGNRRSLFRAVDVDEDESEEFEKAMSKGSIVDIPLLATADRRSQGLNEYLTKYGKDYLIEIEDGAESAEAGVFDPMWSRRDEDDTLNRIEGLAQSIQDEIDAGYFDDDKDEKKERKEQVTLMRHLVAVYERKREQGSEKRAKAREELAEAVSDYFGGDLEGTFEDGEGLNWEGEIISEDDGQAFWDAYDSEYMGGYSETQPREQITGGRFEVLEVGEDPEGVYGKIIKLRQIGVFDPQNPGLVVPKVKKG